MLVLAAPAALLLFLQGSAPRPAPPGGFTSLSFYVAGHQDDWELFRGNAASKDLKGLVGLWVADQDPFSRVARFDLGNGQDIIHGSWPALQVQALTGAA